MPPQDQTTAQPLQPPVSDAPAVPPPVEPYPPQAPAPPSPKVRKPFLWAMLAALVISGGIMAVPYLWPQPVPAPVQPPIQAVVPTPSPLSLQLSSPADGELIMEPKTTVSGQTAPGAIVVVYTDTDEVVTQSDSSGHFSTTVLLNTGINSLTVTAFAENGEEASVSLDVVYNEAGS